MAHVIWAAISAVERVEIPEAKEAIGAVVIYALCGVIPNSNYSKLHKAIFCIFVIASASEFTMS